MAAEIHSEIAKPILFVRSPELLQMRNPLDASWNLALAPVDDATGHDRTPGAGAPDLAELVDFSQMNEIFANYLEVVGLPVAIIDFKGRVLASSRWQRICMEFHRNHRDALSRCLESDTCLSRQMHEGKGYAIYRCRNGLTDCASPIVIEGQHIANLFIGQFFLKAPDLAEFEAQCAEFGFDHDAYFQALREVPIVEEQKVPAILNLLAGLAHQIARQSLAEHRLKRAYADVELQVRQRTRQLAESEGKVRAKLDALLSPEGNLDALELSDIVDCQAIQSIMDDFYRLTNIGMGLIDLQGKVLVATGWQDICMNFHRVNPQSARHCLESDTQLSQGVPPGTVHIYRCKNGMWDMVTPICIAGKHLGNLFLGQFFFEDETPDYAGFRQQARRYGFDEEQYLAAMDKVPRWSREKVDVAMHFYMQFAEIVSRLSHGNISLARSFTEQKLTEQSLRESKEKFKAIANYAASWESWFSPEGKLLWTNFYTEKLTGYTVAECMAADDILALLIAKDDLALVREKFQEALNGGSGDGLEFRCVRKDGSKFWLHVSWWPILDARQRSLGFRASGQDITARIRIEEALATAKAAAETANQAKSEFLANMSHEIRTPLNAMLGLAQVLQREDLSSDQHDMVRQIRVSGNTLLGIINHILDFSKIEAGHCTIESHPFALAPLLEHLETLHRGIAREKGLTVAIDTAPELAGNLYGDQLRVQQILHNLIGNAIKFTKQGGVLVRISLMNLTDTAARLRFEVRDTGIGIPSDALAHLFMPFTQADGSITRRFGGSGLGLSITKRLVELMGGTISVESTPGIGSVFSVELTFERTIAVATNHSIQADKRRDNRRLDGRRFLVVDDSEINLDVVKRALGLEGADVVLAGDGNQALKILRAEPQGFDAVLMDIQMPGMDGLAATRYIRGELGLMDLPIFALTAGVLAKHKQSAEQAGITGFLIKPLDFELLISLLQSCGREACATSARENTAAVADTTTGNSGSMISEGIPGLDQERVREVFGEEQQFFKEIIRKFVVKYADVPRKIESLLADDDRLAATRELHKLGGAASNIGLQQIAALTAHLERIIKLKEDDSAGPLAELAAAFTEIRAAIASWQSES